MSRFPHSVALATAALLMALACPATAQQTTPNPLRPNAGESRKPGESQKTEEARPAEKPRRERSEAQRRNDDMMRTCGSEWRAEKAALQAKGETWRSFLKDCRARKKAETPV